MTNISNNLPVDPVQVVEPPFSSLVVVNDQVPRTQPDAIVDLDLPQVPMVVELPPILHVSSEFLSVSDRPRQGSPNHIATGASTSKNASSNSWSNLDVGNLASCWANKRKSKAEKIWEFEKEVGVSGTLPDGIYGEKV